MAMLCRTSGMDVLMLLAPRTYAQINRVELPTVDAAGLKWSRDGPSCECVFGLWLYISARFYW